MDRARQILMVTLLTLMVGMWSWRLTGRAWALDYMGRPIAQTMHYTGAQWLTRTEREREEGSRKLLKALQLSSGETACDIGAGNGYYTLKMAEAVGPTGRVYAIDIQPEMLQMLQTRATAAGLSNITPILSTPTDPKLPTGECDVTLLVDVYHEFSDPEAMLRGLHRSLTPDGEIALAEFRAEDPQIPIKPLHKMSKAQIMKELQANRFKLVREANNLPWQHLMFFQRDDGPGVAIAPEPYR
ncbi:MAG: class I SAM-dependent methyltransferase [Myxococcota bacterium]